MAIRTWQGDAGGGDFDWSTVANWDTGVPLDADNAVLDIAVQCDLDLGDQLTDITMTGFTSTFDVLDAELLATGNAILDGDIDNSTGALGAVIVSGSVTLTAAMTFSATAGVVELVCDNDVVDKLLTTAGVAGYDLEMLGSEKITQQDAVTCNGFLMSSGTWDAANQGMTINGSGGLNVTGGTAISNMVLTLDADMNANLNIYACRADELVVQVGRTINLIDDIDLIKLSNHGTIASATDKYIVVYPVASGWWAGTDSALDLSVTLVEPGYAAGADIVLNNKTLSIYTHSTHTLAMDADIRIGTGELKVFGTGASDVMILNMNGNDLTCGAAKIGSTGATAGLGKLTLGGGIHAIASITVGNAANNTGIVEFDTCTLVASGDITLDGIAATAGACDITAANFNIGNAFGTAGNGSLTMSADLTLTADFELDGAGADLDFGSASNTIFHSGDFIRTLGTFTNPGIVSFVGSGNVKNADSGNVWAELAVAASVTVTLTGNVYTKKVTKHADGTLTGSSLQIANASAGWWNVSGAVNSAITLNDIMASPGAGIILSNQAFVISTFSGADRAITIDGDLNIGTGVLLIKTNTATKKYTLTMDGTALTSGNVVLGDNDSSGSGVLNLGSGSHVVTGDIDDGNDANTNNALDLGTGSLSLGGTFEGNDDGTNKITVTTSGGVIVGGTVNNVDATTEVFHLYPAAAGTGNTNITEISPPINTSAGTRGRNSYRAAYRGAYRRAS